MSGAGLLLAWDTSTPTAHVALVDGPGAVRAQASGVAARHSTHLLGLVDAVLVQAGVTLGAVEAIACGRGPGSFTGLRVGLAVAKGLALPGDIALVLVSSLEALARDIAEAAPAAGHVVPVLDAGKGQVYAAVFAASGGRVEAVSPEWVLDPAALASDLAARFPRAVVGGPGTAIAGAAAALAGCPVQAVGGPSALAVARLARARLLQGERDDLATAAPAYGRPPDITTPKARKVGSHRTGAARRGAARRPRGVRMNAKVTIEPREELSMDASPTDPSSEIALLRERHVALDRRLQALDRHLSLTSEEQLERARLKKEKLATKDQIARLERAAGRNGGA